jgi:integrase
MFGQPGRNLGRKEVTMPGYTFKRCGCTDPESGRRLDGACPRLKRARHGSWYYAAELPPGPDGKRRRVRRGGFHTDAVASEALRTLLATSASKPGDSSAEPTVAEWLEHWLHEKSKSGAASAAGRKVRATTSRAYRSHLDLYLLPTLGSLPLTALTDGHISAMFESIHDANAAKTRPTSAATMRRIFATLRAALNEAVRRHHILSNPCVGVELASAARPKPVVWTDERVAAWKAGARRPKVAVWTPVQTGAFLDTAADDRLYALYHLIAFRGLRRGEAVGLAWTEVDLTGATVTVSWQVVQLGWDTTEGAPKSDASGRVVALDSATVEVLCTHRDLQNYERARAGDAWVDTGRLFTRIDGTGLHPGYVTTHFARLVKRAGLPPVRLHDLRHGAATLALAGGANLKVVQEMLGHASISITADTYTSVLPDVAREAAEAAARLVPRGSSPIDSPE